MWTKCSIWTEVEIETWLTCTIWHYRKFTNEHIVRKQRFSILGIKSLKSNQNYKCTGDANRRHGRFFGFKYGIIKHLSTTNRNQQMECMKYLCDLNREPHEIKWPKNTDRRSNWTEPGHKLNVDAIYRYVQLFFFKFFKLKLAEIDSWKPHGAVVWWEMLTNWSVTPIP